MRALKALTLSACLVGGTSCQPDDPPPDLAAISADFCAIFQMCSPDAFEVGWGTLDECETGSLALFDKAKERGEGRFDARIARLTCVGEYERCEEYDMEDEECLLKIDNYLNECGGL